MAALSLWPPRFRAARGASGFSPTNSLRPWMTTLLPSRRRSTLAIEIYKPPRRMIGLDQKLKGRGSPGPLSRDDCMAYNTIADLSGTV